MYIEFVIIYVLLIIAIALLVVNLVVTLKGKKSSDISSYSSSFVTPQTQASNTSAPAQTPAPAQSQAPAGNVGIAFCTKCAKPLPANEKFCPNCGNPR